MEEVKVFILGKNRVPDWFMKACEKGRAKLVMDQSGKAKEAVIHMVSRTVTAYAGDTIMLLESGIIAVPKEKAKKYKVQRK